jgi:DNA polymerase-3 subunit epsilon
MRQIVLDTETTGLNADRGHRIIEIGCVELCERRRTGRVFQRYLNPERAIDAGAQEVHGISDEFLRDKPRFGEIVGEFIEFVRGAELIIHNAAFDLAFLDAEFALLGGRGRISDHVTVLDTLSLARERYPGQRNGLDALCKRLGVDNSHRDLHGALLDASLLADVYLAMTAGQASLTLAADVAVAAASGPAVRAASVAKVRLLRADAEESRRHEARLDGVAKACKGAVVWRRS